MILRALLFISIVMGAVAAAAQYASVNPLDNSTYSDRGIRSVLSGTVRDQNNRPLAEVRIELQDLASGRVLGTTYSNVTGNYELRDVPKGQFEVAAFFALSEARSRVEFPGASEVNLRIVTATGTDNHTGGKNSVSLSQMKVPGKARKLFQKAMDAFRMSHLDDAFSLVQKAIGVYPDYAQALTLRGVMNMQRGDTRSAEPDLQKAVELDYSDDMSFIALASLYNAEGRFDNAIQILDRGLTVHPKSWQALSEMARAQIGKGDYQSALKSLAQAEPYAPANVTYLHLYRAQGLAGIGNVPGAITEIQAFLAKEPQGENANVARKMLATLKGSETTDAKK
jgi:tetratricopeptide (TPR) repeat protein